MLKLFLQIVRVVDAGKAAPGDQASGWGDMSAR